MKEVTKEMLGKLDHRTQVMFALFCARQVEHLWKDTPEAGEAIETVKGWLVGKATREECRVAADAAYAAATYAASYAAAKAANAAYAAANAAKAGAWTAEAAAKATGSDADKTKIIKEQLEHYDDLLAIVDGRIDKILTGDAY